MAVRAIDDEPHFRAELSEAGLKLVVVDFTATWCGPCQRVAPYFQTLSNRYQKAIFLKVDVDKCPELAASQDVSAMPTFVFYRNREKIDKIQGSDIIALESKIQQLVATTGDEDEEEYGPGLMELNSYILKKECECLNEDDNNCMHNCLDTGKGYLQSDCDDQLILSLTFSQTVKVHSLKIVAPPQKGPKDIKIFINQPRTIDFDMAESMESVQDLTIEPEALENGEPICLRFVKFQNVQNIQVYVRNNQSGGDVTQIDYLGVIGIPVQTTKMYDFKRVAGIKGESH